MSYGQRYLLKLIFNIAVGEDRDGNKPQEPTTAFADAARAAIQRLTVPDACDKWWKDNVAAIRGASQADRDDVIAFLRDHKATLKTGAA